MADEKEKKESKENKEPESKDGEGQKDEKQKAPSFGLVTWIVMAAIVMAGFAGGFALAQLIAGSGPEATQAGKADEAETNDASEDPAVNDMLIEKPQDEKPWSYDLEPVIANLDEPGVTRYARVAITLHLSPQMDLAKGTPFLDGKKAVLRDWLTTYIAGLSLERVRGTRNLARIKKEVRDSFNELLFPQSKPFVSDILFKEFAIQ
ncbi:MAG: flagellar basal body-associated FliL family protein [Planctomycetota bacterium]|jgi:flagellar basal body-associated protein FliL